MHCSTFVAVQRMDVENVFTFLKNLVTFFTFLTFFLFSKRVFILKKSWQSSKRQAD